MWLPEGLYRTKPFAMFLIGGLGMMTGHVVGIVAGILLMALALVIFRMRTA